MMNRTLRRCLVSFLGLLALFGLQAAAQDKPVPPDHAASMAASQKLFTEQVRPFLEKNCLECHGGGKAKSGFSMATRELLLKGGDKGEAVKLGKGRQSALVRFMAHEEEPHMPPKKPAAPRAVVEAMARWIDLGAAYDRPFAEVASGGTKKPLIVTDKDRDYWAYRPLQRVTPPTVQDVRWPRTPIDRFLLAKMEEKGITPSGDADPRTLIRRVYFDLIGLPPTPEEVEAFVRAHRAEPQAALEAVVDRLLDSPHFGERWARHWLDPARFAESHGFEHDYRRPFAYHYRDFVIKAFNQDMPYDQFVRWQLAGDELAPDDPLALAATGFLGAGVYPTQITTREAERVRYDAMDDMLATTGQTMLALTIGCARCHDHKYDPIPVRDYYQLLTAFTTTVRSEIDVDLGIDAEKQAMRAFEAKLQPFLDARKQYEEKELPARFDEWLTEQRAKSPNAPSAKDQPTAKLLKAIWDGSRPFGKLDAKSRELVLTWFKPQDAEWQTRNAKVQQLEKERPKETRVKMQVCSEGVKPMRHHVADGSIPDIYPQTFYLKRGDTAQKDGVAEQGFLQVLMRHPEGAAAWVSAKPQAARTSFRRVGLAKWLTDTDQGAGALAARVIVNRLWHHHFGRGLVTTINDFGLQGDLPTHPELLEWLAADLVQHDWKLKRLHKLMVLSRAYRLSGVVTATNQKADPENRLCWHRPRRRLEAEIIRDNLLAVSGLLDRTMFGPGTLDPTMRRRSIYFTIQRSQMIPMLQVFDWPDTLTSSAARPNTVVAPQALLFLNNPQVRACATALAGRLKPAAEKTLPEAITLAYQAVFGRPPSARETAEGAAFLSARRDLDRALVDYSLVLLSLNEFIYID